MRIMLAEKHPNLFKSILGIGLADIGFGLVFKFAPYEYVSAPHYQIIRELMPIQLWGTLFCLVGGLVLLSLFYGNHRFTRYALSLGTVMACMSATALAIAAYVGRLNAITILVAWLFIAWIHYINSIEPPSNPVATMISRESK